MNTIFTQLLEGERYAGTIIGSITCKPTHHLILLPQQPETILTWHEAIAWAAAINVELPTRQESALLYANLKPAFESDWYWTSEQYAGYAGGVWLQHFKDGTQYHYGKAYMGRVRAIRRVPITEEHTQMSRFTEEQLKELETVFGLKREEETFSCKHNSQK